MTYSGTAYFYRHHLLISTLARHEAQSNNAKSMQSAQLELQRVDAVKRKARQCMTDGMLVTPTNHVNLPDLLTVYRGHASRVTCVKIVRVGTDVRIFSGSMDGTVIVWDLRTGAPLSIISAHDQGVSSIDILSVEAVGARRPQFMSTHMVRRTTTPNWDAPHVTADLESAEPTRLNARGSGFIFEVENMQQSVTLRVYAVVQDRGDVVVGCASITLQDALKKAYETDCAERVTLHVPLLLLLPKASQAQKLDSDAEEQGIRELNSPDAGAGALLNMLAAASIHSTGATGEAFGLDFQVTGELDVTLAYRRASGGQKESSSSPCAHQSGPPLGFVKAS